MCEESFKKTYQRKEIALPFAIQRDSCLVVLDKGLQTAKMEDML